MDAYPHAMTDEVLKGVLGGLDGWAIHHRMLITANIPNRALVPSVLLDATIPWDDVCKAWPDHSVTLVDVEVRSNPDGHMARYIVAKRLGRTRLIKSPREWWRLSKKAISDAIKKEERNNLQIGIITHKPAAEAMRKGRCDLPTILNNAKEAGDKSKVTGILHYGNCRGYNILEAVDLLITIGDPIPHLGMAEWEASILGVLPDQYIYRIVEAELSQAHGRARALRRDSSQRVTLVHVGGFRPTGPGWDIKYSTEVQKNNGMSVDEAIRYALAIVGIVAPGDQGYLALSYAHEILNKNNNLRDMVIKKNPIYQTPEIVEITKVFLREPQLAEAAVILSSIDSRRWPDQIALINLPIQVVEWKHRGPRPRKVYCVDPERGKKVIQILTKIPTPQIESPKPPPRFYEGTFEDLAPLFGPEPMYVSPGYRGKRKHRKDT